MAQPVEILTTKLWYVEITNIPPSTDGLRVTHYQRTYVRQKHADLSTVPGSKVKSSVV